MPVDVRRKGEDGFFGSLAIWAALFACKAPYHQDRVRKNADALLDKNDCEGKRNNNSTKKCVRGSETGLILAPL